MTDSMIANPQFQIYSIDEEESQRTSMRESEREQRITEDSLRKINEKADQVETPISQGPGPNQEDMYRNDHLRPSENHTVTINRPPSSLSQDIIAQQIEDYQKNSLANLAALLN